MIRKRRVIAAGIVVTIATIAACLGPHWSTIEQPTIIIQGGNPQMIMPDPVMVGTSGDVLVTLQPASGPTSSVDQITMITESCPLFELEYPMGMPPAFVSRMCGSGSDIMPTATAEPNATTCTDQNFSFRVKFTPTGSGPADCFVSVFGDSPITVHVVANAIAPSVGIDVQPPMLQFGEVRVGNSATLPLTIRSTGTGPLMINSVTTGMAGIYSLAPPANLGAHMIPGMASEVVQVTCTPTSAGTYNSAVTVNSSLGITTIPSFCKGVVSDLVVTPTPIDVTTRLDEMVEKNVTIQNVGAGSSTINSLTITSTIPGIPITLVPPTPPGQFILFAGSSAAARVRYLPTAAQANQELAKLHIVHDTTMMRDITINGGALRTTIVALPGQVDFGPICANVTESKDVVVQAPTEGSFTLSSIDPPAAPFAIRTKAGTMLPGTAMGLQANKLEFIASVTPTGPGTLESKAVLQTDIPKFATHDLIFKAEVLSGGVGASPQTLDFGGVIKKTLSSAMFAEVRNCSDGPIDVSGVRIDGINREDFSIILPAPSELVRTLQPREVVKYHVVMRSETPGAKIATLVVATPAGVATQVGLVGTALGGGDGDGKDIRSYYGRCSDCQAGEPGSWWTLVVVVGLLLRRRRRK